MMSISDLKIHEYRNLDVASVPDKLTGTAAQNKAIFDRLFKGVGAPTFNELIDKLLGEQGAAQIGFAAEQYDLEPEEFAARTVAEALVELFLRSYAKEELDQQLAGREEAYRNAHESLVREVFTLLSRSKGAPASIAGVEHAAGDIKLVGGQGIAITPSQENKQVKITATGTSIPSLHAEEHLPDGADPLTAEIAYDNGRSGMRAATVQEALDELQWLAYPVDAEWQWSDPACLPIVETLRDRKTGRPVLQRVTEQIGREMVITERSYEADGKTVVRERVMRYDRDDRYKRKVEMES